MSSSVYKKKYKEGDITNCMKLEIGLNVFITFDDLQKLLNDKKLINCVSNKFTIVISKCCYNMYKIYFGDINDKIIKSNYLDYKGMKQAMTNKEYVLQELQNSDVKFATTLLEHTLQDYGDWDDYWDDDYCEYFSDYRDEYTCPDGETYEDEDDAILHTLDWLQRRKK